MNDTTLIGPCADHEHDLVDLHDGTLAPERALAVRLHVERCARCRDWMSEFATLDARLAAELPRPELSAAFDDRLQARLAGLARPRLPAGAGQRAAAEFEHDSLIGALRQAARRRALLGAVGAAAAALCGTIVVHDLLVQGGGLLPAVAAGPERWLALGTLGSVVALAGLVWSVWRNGLPALGLAR